MPPNRLDIQAGAADLIEELARSVATTSCRPRCLADPLPAQHGNADLEREEQVRDRLVRSAAGGHHLLADDAGARSAAQSCGR